MKGEITLAKAIKNIAWGYVLIHSAINLGVIDILPDWLGFYLMFVAIRKIREEEETIGLLEPLVKILIGWHAIIWGTKFIGWDLGTFPFTIIINVVSIYFNFQLLTNVANVANRHGSERGKSILILRTVETLMNTILAMIVYLELSEYWMIGVAVIGLITVIWICSVLFGLAKEFETKNEVIL